MESAATAATVPFGMVSLGRDIQAARGGKKDAGTVGVSYNIVNDGYFRTLGIPLLRGRAFASADAAR